MAQAAVPGNLLLAALERDEPGRLAPYLEPVDLARGAVLLEPGAAVERVWFPSGCVVALGAVVREGTVAGVAVGREGAVGLAEALDGRRALARATVLVPGRAWRLPVGPLRAAGETSAAVRRLYEGYVDVLLAEAMQSVSCNANHPAEARLARWLLHLRDRVEDAVAASAEEFVVAMAGLARPAAAEGLRGLERAGLVEYRGELVEVLDWRGLGTAACACYGVIRGSYERLLSGAPDWSGVGAR